MPTSREEGEALERSNPNCWGKCLDYGNLWVNVSLKMQIYKYLGQEEPKFFPMRPFVCCSRNVSRSGVVSRNLCPEKPLVTSLLDHHGWLTKETFKHQIFLF